MIATAKTIWTGTNLGISLLPEGVALITFDNADKRVNILSSAVLGELSTALDRFDELDGVVGLVFLSAKPDSFIVGADINEISQLQGLSWQIGYWASRDGKDLLRRISTIALPTVAAIHGRCLGGGLELALACRKRLVSDSDKTVLTLPEVGLGVIPGWGGTVKAPRLVGLRQALSLVLDPAHPWSGRKAWRNGLVSEVVPENELVSRAVAVAMGARTRDFRPGLAARLVRALENSLVGRHTIKLIARRQIEKKTAGKYPAPLAALKVMMCSLSSQASEAFERESRTFASLLQTPASKELVQSFLARKS